MLLQEQLICHVGISDSRGIPQGCCDLIALHKGDESTEKHGLKLETCSHSISLHGHGEQYSIYSPLL